MIRVLQNDPSAANERAEKGEPSSARPSRLPPFANVSFGTELPAPREPSSASVSC